MTTKMRLVILMTLCMTSLTCGQPGGSGQSTKSEQPQPPPVPPGHPKPYNTTLKDPLVLSAVEFINVFYLHQGENPHTPLEILNATVQVIAGWMYNFSLEMRDEHLKYNSVCNVTILNKPWLNFTEQIGSIQCNDTEQPKPTPVPPGHPKPYNTTLKDPLVLSAVQFINVFYLHHGDNPHTPLEILNATVQVIAGWRYNFSFVMRDEHLKYNSVCNVSVWNKPWLNITEQFGSIQCNDTEHPQPPPVPRGHPTHYNTTLQDPLVEYAVQCINVNYLHSGDNPHTPLKILNATVQVIAGWMYNFSLEMRDEHLKYNSVCNVTVWNKPWLNMTEQFGSIQCNDTEQPHPAGRPKPYNTTMNDPLVVYAAECINAFYLRMDDNPHMPIKILNATVEVIAGWMYNFSLEMRDEHLKYNSVCNVTVWNKPWLNMTSQIGSIQCNDTHPPPVPPGHPIPYNTTLKDPKVVYGVECINDYYRSKGDEKLRTAVKLINSTVQVATGQVFRFSIEVTDGSCMEVCDVTLLDRPGVNTNVTQLGHPTCNDESEITGLNRELDLSDQWG